jgi:hypothetical protein
MRRQRCSRSGSFHLGQAGDAAQVELAGISGTLDLTVVDPIAGALSDSIHPGSGTVKVAADDGSCVTMLVQAGGVVTLEVDADHDGATDAWATTVFDELE